MIDRLAVRIGAGTPDVTLSPGPSSPRISAWWSAAFIVAAIVAAFASGLWTPFQYDDLSTVVENVTIRDLSAVSTVLSPVADVSPTAGRPVLNVSFALDYAVAGLNVVAYHATNIALHAICALLLFAVVRTTLRLPPARFDRHADVMAAMVAAIWAVHPLQSGAVTYISGRSDVLAGVWFMATLYAAIRAHASTRGSFWTLAAIVACAVGMASKESVATAPVAVVLYDRAYFYRRFPDALRERWPLYTGLALTWAIVAALALQAPRSESAGFSTDISPWTYLLNQAIVIPEYFRLVVWPDYLLFAYGASRHMTLVDAGATAAVVPLLLAASIWLWIRRPALGFPALWVFLTLAPTSSIVPIATEAGAARRMYLPLAGVAVLFVIAIATLTERWQRRRTGARARSATALGSLVVVALAATTEGQGREFASPERLWRGSLERWPSALAHRNLAAVLLQQGRRAEGADELRAAAELNPVARYSLGVELFEEGRAAEAIVELRRAILEFPSQHTIALEGRRVLARALQQQGRHLEAAEVFGEVAAMTPEDVTPMLARADELRAGGNLPAAHQAYQRILDTHPAHTGAMTNDGLTLLRLGRSSEALPLLQVVADREPQNVSAFMNLAGAFSVAGRLADASAAVCHAIAIDPQNPAPQQFLAELRGAAAAARLSPPQCGPLAAR